MPRQFRLKTNRVYVLVDDEKAGDDFKQCGKEHPHVVVRKRINHALKGLLAEIQIEAASQVLSENEELVGHLQTVATMSKINESSKLQAQKAMRDAGFTMADVRDFNAKQGAKTHRATLYEHAVMIQKLGGDWTLYPYDVAGMDWPPMSYRLTDPSKADRVREDIESRVDFLSLLAEEDLEEIAKVYKPELGLTEKEKGNSDASPS